MLHKHLGAYSLSSFGIFPHNQCYMEPYVSQKKRCMAFGDMEEYCLGKAIWLPAKSHQSGRISQISKCMGHCGRLNNSPLKMSTMYSLEPVNMFVLHCKRDFADVVWLRILRWEIILDYLAGPSVITKALIRGRQEGQGNRRRCEYRSRDQREREKGWL